MKRATPLVLVSTLVLQGCASAPTEAPHDPQAQSVAWYGNPPRYRVCMPPYCPGPTPKTPARGGSTPAASETAPSSSTNSTGVSQETETTQPATEASRTFLVHFDHDSAILPPDFDAQRITTWPIEAVRITGYTDSTGEADYNQWLALRRARAVRDALVAQGVPADRIAVEGRGECCYVQPNSSAEGRQANRRAEIIVTYATRNQGGSS